MSSTMTTIAIFCLLFLLLMQYSQCFLKEAGRSLCFRTDFHHRIRLNCVINEDIKINSSAFWKTVSAVSVISGPLGTLLDNQHGLFKTLEYTSYQIQLSLNNHLILKTAIWVPFLFTFAGFIMSTLILLLDNKLEMPEKSLNMTWPKVFYGISFFAWQYYISGWLDATGLLSPLQINVILSVLAYIGYSLFDGTKSGLILASLTAFAGPVVEVGIINLLHIYYYSNADFYGICSWIPAVYFLGGQAVGNLTRMIYSVFKSSHELPKQ